MHLPDLPGEEVLRRLRASPATRSIPVVMVSADAIPARAEALLMEGAADYLTKPLDVTRLLQVTRGHLRPERADPAPIPAR